MDLRDFVRLLARNWILLVALLMLGLIAASAYGLLKTPEYQATSKAYISTNTGDNVAEFNQGNTAVQQIVKSYAEVATTPYVLDPVIRELDLNVSPAALASQITANTPTDTVVLELTVSDRSARRAANIANAVTQNLSAAVTRLSLDEVGTAAVVKVTRVQAATAPSQPSAPNLPASLVIGVLLGAAAGIAIAMLRERLDTKIRSARDVEALTSHAVLGRISFSPQSATQPLVEIDSQHSLRAEEYRTLRTNLQFVNFESAARVLVVTSSIASEGKSTTVANLGIVLAGTGRRVLLIDGDLRRPKLGDHLGLESGVGLTDVLIGQVGLQHAVQSSRTNLDVLTSGVIPPNPSELLQSRSMIELLEQVGKMYDTVLIDTPPLLPVSDGAILAKMSHGAIVVCAANRVRRQQLQGALTALDHVGATVVGIVPTMLSRRARAADGYGAGYSYSYGYTSQGSTA